MIEYTHCACGAVYNPDTTKSCPICRYNPKPVKWVCPRCGSDNEKHKTNGMCRKCYEKVRNRTDYYRFLARKRKEKWKLKSGTPQNLTLPL